MAAGRCNIASGGLRIKSAQSGYLTLFGDHAVDTRKTIKINPVDLAKSILIIAVKGEPEYYETTVQAKFTSDHEIYFEQGSYGLQSDIEWQVLELEGFKSLQSVSVKIDSSGSSAPKRDVTKVPITFVSDYKKCLLFYNFKSYISYSGPECGITAYLASSVSIGVYRYDPRQDIHFNAWVVELY